MNEKKIFHNFLIKYKSKNQSDISLDLGCGNNISNPFNASDCIGLDINANEKKNVISCKLGIDKIPFESASVNYVTAFDLIEHLPRIYIKNGKLTNPFIFLMNEIWRVLKKDGIFFSKTPFFPFPASFQDPTHCNFITHKTFEFYFSKKRLKISKSYGIKTNFEILEEKIYDQHYLSIMKK